MENKLECILCGSVGMFEVEKNVFGWVMWEFDCIEGVFGFDV